MNNNNNNFKDSSQTSKEDYYEQQQNQNMFDKKYKKIQSKLITVLVQIQLVMKY